MHFVSLVPLSLGILFVVVVAIAKGILILTLAIIALIAWIIYELFFKKEKIEEEERNPEAEFWEQMMEKQEKEDKEFYRQIGRLEQQLDDIEEAAGIKRRKRNRKN
jgi:uncharacterized membrane protein (DUF106 family)